MNTTNVNDIISIELVWDEAVMCSDDETKLADRILESTKILWDLVDSLRHATLSDREITRGCLLSKYLQSLLEEYYETGADDIDGPHIFFAHAVVMAWTDLCP